MYGERQVLLLPPVILDGIGYLFVDITSGIMILELDFSARNWEAQVEMLLVIINMLTHHQNFLVMAFKLVIVKVEILG